MSATSEHRGRRGPPPAQHNLQTATDLAVRKLRAQSPEQIARLGAEPAGDGCRLRVLDDTLEVCRDTGSVRTSAGRDVRPQWRILVLHYLTCGADPQPAPPALTFADLPDARAYARVYHGRVVERLCATAGRNAETLRAAAATLGARPADGGDLAFDIDVFPRLSVRLIWYAGDDELPPSATVLLPSNIRSMLCLEDIVVLSERVVSRLSGLPF